MTQKTLRHYPDGGLEVKVGDEVVLIERYNTNSGTTQWLIRIAPDGIGGNSNRHIKRYHGWRGTTNNISITAHGLRRVIKATDKKYDYEIYQKVTVGPDLHPDWE